MEQIKGAKYDDGKPRPSLVPVEAIEAIMQVREYGMRKYGDAEDWRTIAPERWHDALLRHVLHIWDNPLALDYESGLPALWHVATNAAFLCAAYKDELDKAREQWAKDVLDEKAYQKARLKVYRFLVDVAMDGVVLPKPAPGTRSLKAADSPETLDDDWDL